MQLEPPTVLDEEVTLLPHQPIPGIYLLCRNKVVVYIGASSDIVTSVHRPDIARTEWDRAYYLRVEDGAERHRKRNTMICKYLPRFNAVGNCKGAA